MFQNRTCCKSRIITKFIKAFSDNIIVQYSLIVKEVIQVSKLTNIEQVDKNLVLVALYDIYDLPKSTLSQTLNMTQDQIDEIKNKPVFQDVKTTLEALSNNALSVEQVVDDPRQMDIMITTQRFALYKDIQELMKISMDVLRDDLYQTKKHLVIQSIAILTNNLRQLLQDMSKPLNSQIVNGGQVQGNQLNTQDVMSVITASISNHED